MMALNHRLWKAMVPLIVRELDKKRVIFGTTHFSFEKLGLKLIYTQLQKDKSFIYYTPTPEVLCMLKLLRKCRVSPSNADEIWLSRDLWQASRMERALENCAAGVLCWRRVENAPNRPARLLPLQGDSYT